MVVRRIWCEDLKGESRKLHFYHGRERNELKGIPGEMICGSTEGRFELQYLGWTRENE